MSKTLLDALKKHNLQQYYPTFHMNGITYTDIIKRVGENEFSSLYLKSAEDKTRFQALYKDSNERKPTPFSNNSNTNTLGRVGSERQTNKTPPRPNKTPKEPLEKTEPFDSSSYRNESVMSTRILKKEPLYTFKNDTTIPLKTEGPSRKRPLPTGRLSPERKARRMTMAPTTTLQRTPPPPSGKLPFNHRRLSSLPRERATLHRSPPALAPPQQQTTSPQRRLKRPKILDDPMKIVQKEASPVERPTTRLLDAYGVPITSQRQLHKSTTELPKSLEEFLLAKEKANQGTSSTVYNELHQKIRVCVRKRPLSKKELAMQETDIAPLVGSRTIQLNAPKTRIDLSRYTEKHSFTFDDAFDDRSSNEQIYARTAQPLVEYIFSGGKATCFAHGQTGSGKTYTMLDPHHGLYVLAAHDIFHLLSKPEYAHLTASVGFYEIYQGQLYDLLNQREKLTARDDGNKNVVIAGLREHAIADVDQLMSIFEYGNQGRTTGQTVANETSSRSHAVLQILLKRKDSANKVYGKLSFIDLAGSERGADRGDADVKTRMEGAEINKSLLALKECIRALDQDQRHTPFRGSKLTQVLRDSFQGDSRTCMIATISPNNSNSEHTLNTLRYADRVKQLRGESDPRIATSGQVKSTLFDQQEDTDTVSMASFEENENLLEVDFPTTVTTNSLGTPTNADRFWPVSEDRQRNYLKRLESPPAEVFDQHTIMKDPFYSKPIQHNATPPPPPPLPSIEADQVEKEKREHEAMESMKRFIEFHRKQLALYNECIRDEQKMIGKVALTMSGYETDQAEFQQCIKDFEIYMNDVETVVDRQSGLIEVFKDRLKGQYEYE